MELSSLVRKSDYEWWITQTGTMRVPGVIYGSETLVRDMDEKVREQVTNVAMLPGIQRASYAMPDAHWGYGFPIGGVAAFDPQQGGIVSAGGVGFDISCGVRTLHTGLAMSRHQALRTWKGRQVIDELAARGIIVRSPSSRGVAEEAPGAYKDVGAVVDAADAAGLSRKVAKLVPLVCVKG